MYIRKNHPDPFLFQRSFPNFWRAYTLPETNGQLALENRWLEEDCFLLGHGRRLFFQGSTGWIRFETAVYFWGMGAAWTSQKVRINGCYNPNILKYTQIITHTIHVWYIYLHLPYKSTKCRQIYHTWILWVSRWKSPISLSLILVFPSGDILSHWFFFPNSRWNT